MNMIDGSAMRAVFVRANIAPLFPEALPSAPGASLPQYAIRFPASDLCASESDVLYKPYNQLSGNKKSFHLSEYLFSSNIKKLFFDINLFYDASIAHLWYTGMQASRLFEAPNDGASVEVPDTADKTRSSDAGDFFVPYRDFDNRALCLYRRNRRPADDKRAHRACKAGICRSGERERRGSKPRICVHPAALCRYAL